MGFRTLAIQKRSSEVWNLLAVVKTEFGKFGEALSGVKEKLDQAARKIEDVDVRSRAITKKFARCGGIAVESAAVAQGVIGRVGSGVTQPVLAVSCPDDHNAAWKPARPRHARTLCYSTSSHLL